MYSLRTSRISLPGSSLEMQSLGPCSRAANAVSQGWDLDPALVGMLMMCAQVCGSLSKAMISASVRRGMDDGPLWRSGPGVARGLRRAWTLLFIRCGQSVSGVFPELLHRWKVLLGPSVQLTHFFSFMDHTFGVISNNSSLSPRSRRFWPSARGHKSHSWVLRRSKHHWLK